MSKLQHIVSPLGRLFIALLFIIMGWEKFSNFTVYKAELGSFGLLGIFLPLVILLEVVGGLAIVAGFQTRLVSAALAAFCIITAVVFHTNFSDEIEVVMFLKNIGIAGGFLFLVANGPGAFSLDNYFALKKH